MQYEEFIDRVRQRAGLGSFSEAEEATQATLTAIGEYLVGGEGLDLASQLPQGLAEHLRREPPDRPMMEIVQAGIDPEKRREAFPAIPLERTSVTGLRHVIGTVSMARTPEADSARADFFICLDDQPSLDFGGKRFEDGQGAAAFGRIVAGMDVVRKIQQQPVQKQALTPPIPITKATRVPSVR